jgi:hypothetical protein
LSFLLGIAVGTGAPVAVVRAEAGSLNNQKYALGKLGVSRRQSTTMAAMGCFGIALLGLYFIFVSTNTPTSLSACAMYIVGIVVGVMLLQSQE